MLNATHLVLSGDPHPPGFAKAAPGTFSRNGRRVQIVNPHSKNKPNAWDDFFNDTATVSKDLDMERNHQPPIERQEMDKSGKVNNDRHGV